MVCREIFLQALPRSFKSANFCKFPMYTVEEERVGTDYPVTPSFEDFLREMKLNIISYTKNELEFDLVNSHASVANALRRILISEVPSIAIHNVTVRENNTIFPDEYIAHRLGFVPIMFDAELIEDDSEENTFLFKLSVKNNTQNIQCIYSNEITWIPRPGQEKLKVDIHHGILICKLAPGHEIDIDLSTKRGIGSTHAKWSPVSLCSYRLMPQINLLREFTGEEALELQKCFSPGVIDVHDGKAVVSNARIDSMSREVFRHPALKNGVKITRVHNWFCFTMETLWEDPIVVLKKALRILKENSSNIRKAIISEMDPSYNF